MISTACIRESEELFSEEDLRAIQLLPIPHHVAIIMDGNRRWAKKRNLPVFAGHSRGADNLYDIVKGACKLGVKVLTVFAFSTENWKRPSVEVKPLMELFKMHLIRQTETMVEEGIRLNVIGDISKLPSSLQKVLKEAVEYTSKGTKLDLVIALNYGGRDDIKRALISIVEECLAKKIHKEDLTEELIGKYLDTAKWKDPDLLIRTSGENRISNFLLWQISYSEVVITEVLWPDFQPKHLLEAIKEYQQRELRLGK